jgi:uncharacterized protein
MLRRFVLCLSIALLLVSGVSTFAVSIKDINPTSFVTDQANSLNEAEQTTLESQLATLRQTRNAEGAVVLVDMLEGQDIASYAGELFEKIKVGEKSKDNGFLILLAINDRKSRIEVGYGLEGRLTDARSGRLLDGARTQFRANQYGAGLSSIVTDIDKLFAGDAELAKRLDTPATKKTDWFQYIFWILWGVILVVPWLGAIFARSKSWWAGGVLGAASGSVFGFTLGWVWFGVAGILGLGIVGLILDWFVSKNYKEGKQEGGVDWWAGGGNNYWFDSSSGSNSGGGFGGFGGGSSGGGGASSDW